MRNINVRFELANGEIQEVLEEMDKALGVINDCYFKLKDMRVIEDCQDDAPPRRERGEIKLEAKEFDIREAIKEQAEILVNTGNAIDTELCIRKIDALIRVLQADEKIIRD